MSNVDESSECKHPLRALSFKKQPSADKIEVHMRLFRPAFIKYIKDYYADKDFFFPQQHNKSTHCDCFKQLFDVET